MQIEFFICISQNFTFFNYNFSFIISTKMQGFFQEGVQQFTFYQKDIEGKKSRHQKRVQKIQKLKHDMEDPQMKKKRHELRRAQEKNKLRKQLQGLSEEQARKFLDQKKQKKRIARQRTKKAVTQGQPIFIDMVFQKKMNQKQNKSLAIQIQLIMKALKHIQQPPGIHLCSVGGVVQTQLIKMCYNFWTLTSHTEDVTQVAQKMGKKLVYLSPDAPQPLQQIDIGTAYIIGGLVDRTVLKNASLNRANQLGIPAKHLPIREFMKSRTCLNLDHVVKIISKFKQVGNWKQAFEYGAPQRWARKQGQNSLRKVQKQSDQEENQQKNQIECIKEEQKIQVKKQQKIQVNQQNFVQTLQQQVAKLSIQ